MSSTLDVFVCAALLRFDSDCFDLGESKKLLKRLQKEYFENILFEAGYRPIWQLVR